MQDDGYTPQDPDLEDDFDLDEDPEDMNESDDDFLDDLDVVLADD